MPVASRDGRRYSDCEDEDEDAEADERTHYTLPLPPCPLSSPEGKPRSPFPIRLERPVVLACWGEDVELIAVRSLGEVGGRPELL